MEKNKTIEVLSKLSEKTFEDSKVKQVFEAETIFGSVLDDSIGILLTSNKKADKIILQIGKTKINLNTDAFDFLIKSVVTLGAMLAAEENNDFRARIKEQYLNKGEPDLRTSFCKVKTKFPSKEGVDENISYITEHTDKIVRALHGKIPITPSQADIEHRKKDLLKTAFRAKDLSVQMKADFDKMIETGYSVQESDYDLILDSILFSENKIKEIKSTEELEKMAKISLELLNNTRGAIDCHKNAVKILPAELQADILEGLLSVLEKGIAELEDSEEKVVDLSDDDSVNAYLDSILKEKEAEADSKAPSIEEGVMEEVAEVESVDLTPSDAFDKFMSEMSIDTEEEEVELAENDLKRTIENPLTPEECFAEEETIGQYNQLLHEVDDNDEATSPYEVQEEEEEEDEFDWSQSTVNDAEEEIQQGFDSEDYSTGTSIVEDEEVEEEEDFVDNDFLKRMADLESTLTGNFEKLEEEIPTFEKIEKLRVDHGELAAKEYVSSLSQEQREHLVKERLAMKLAAAQAIEGTNIKQE